MAQQYYFVSDLHMGGDGQLQLCDYTAEFLAFLKELAGQDLDTELLIVGDTFGFWELTTVHGVAKLEHIIRAHQAIFDQLVLVPFPHPGMKVPAFVTASCRDTESQKVILCVYVPTTPVPTSGYFLLIPEDEVTELNWSPDQTLQTIISAGLMAPSEVSYFKAKLAAESHRAAVSSGD